MNDNINTSTVTPISLADNRTTPSITSNMLKTKSPKEIETNNIPKNNLTLNTSLYQTIKSPISPRLLNGESELIQSTTPVAAPVLSHYYYYKS